MKTLSTKIAFVLISGLYLFLGGCFMTPAINLETDLAGSPDSTGLVAINCEEELILEVFPGKVDYIHLKISGDVPGWKGSRPGYAEHTITGEGVTRDFDVKEEINFWNDFLKQVKKAGKNSPWEYAVGERLEELDSLQ